MALSDVYRVEVFQNVGSEITMNVLHMRETVAETINDNAAACVIEAVIVLYDALKAQMSEDWRVVQMTARRVSPGSGIPSTLVLGGAESIVGAQVSEIIPSASALLISLYSLNFTKSGRGRQYLPGLPETAQNEGQLTEAVHGDFQTIANAQYLGEKGPFLAGDGKWRFTVFGGGAGPGSDQDVKEAIVRPNLATQRGRRAHPGFAA